MQDTGIEWAHHTINQYIGCTKISTGCSNCYAEEIETRFKRPFTTIRRAKGWDNGKLARFLEKTPASRIFADSMYDVGHESFSLEQIKEIFDFVECYPKHQFLFLTKRIGRLKDYTDKYPLPKNVWLGTSVENKAYLWRLDILRSIPANIRFVSFEPLLESLGDINLEGIDWAIVGGESGEKHRPFDLQWAREILAACRVRQIPFFFKQIGGRIWNEGGRILDGRTYDEVPNV